MERRVLLAVVLSFLVLYGYQRFLVPPPPATEDASATTAAPAPDAPEGAPAVGAQGQPAALAPGASPATGTGDAAPGTAVAEALIGETVARDITVETSTVVAVLSNRGGRVVSWKLKGFADASGQPLDLVPEGLAEDAARPFTLVVDDAALTTRLNAALYGVTGAAGNRLDATSTAGTLVFEFQDTSGLQVRKTFQFEPSGYVVRFSATVATAAGPVVPALAWGPGLGDAGARTGGSFFTGNYVQPAEAIYHVDGDVERVSVGDLQTQPVYEGQYRYVGVDDHYFIAALLNPGQVRAEFRPLTIPSPDGTERQQVASTFRLAGGLMDLGIYAGPKQFDALQATDQELVRVINFGVFGFLAVPLLSALKWIHGGVGNWGWSIILLTVLINIAIFPLRHRSVVSMRKMQLLQPKMKAIQDRYAGLKMTDPKRQNMQTEVMNLYRENGVNPASGCVPMLLTLPVLFAFYSLLSQAIELRGAPFGLWITDLSQRDPYYVTPVLMGLTMFWQQRITPSTADPTQQKVMMMMPLIFSFMFLSAPSGLVVYWFVSNLWAIGQQYFTSWMIGPPPVSNVRPPAERRLKNAGAGRTPGATRGN
ncbi:MAG: membrane protein insertase YidC [Vicinamibacterales bacterium]